MSVNNATESLKNVKLDDQEQEVEEGVEEKAIVEDGDSLVIDVDERDEEIEEFAKKFRQIYEREFREHLRSLKKGDMINATSLPTKKYNKDTFDDDSAESTTLVFYFESLDADENNNINCVSAKSFDKSELCHFQPHLCKDYGPYFRTTLYCCMYNQGRKKSSTAEYFFLDLPVKLYNLIDDDE